MPTPEGNTNALGNDGGRPTAYKDDYATQVYELCLLGHTDKEMAGVFGVAESTFNEWKLRHVEFSESIKRGKDIADGKVAVSLYQRATGYSHPDTHFSTYEGQVTETPTTKHYPPDTAAAIFWLKNRQRSKWREKIEVEEQSTVTVTVKRQRKERPDHNG